MQRFTEDQLVELGILSESMSCENLRTIGTRREISNRFLWRGLRNVYNPDHGKFVTLVGEAINAIEVLSEHKRRNAAVRWEDFVVIEGSSENYETQKLVFEKYPQLKEIRHLHAFLTLDSISKYAPEGVSVLDYDGTQAWPKDWSVQQIEDYYFKWMQVGKDASSIVSTLMMKSADVYRSALQSLASKLNVNITIWPGKVDDVSMNSPTRMLNVVYSPKLTKSTWIEISREKQHPDKPILKKDSDILVVREIDPITLKELKTCPSIQSSEARSKKSQTITYSILDFGTPVHILKDVKARYVEDMAHTLVKLEAIRSSSNRFPASLSKIYDVLIESGDRMSSEEVFKWTQRVAEGEAGRHCNFMIIKFRREGEKEFTSTHDSTGLYAGSIPIKDVVKEALAKGKVYSWSDISKAPPDSGFRILKDFSSDISAKKAELRASLKKRAGRKPTSKTPTENEPSSPKKSGRKPGVPVSLNKFYSDLPPKFQISQRLKALEDLGAISEEDSLELYSIYRHSYWFKDKRDEAKAVLDLIGQYEAKALEEAAVWEYLNILFG